MTPSFEGTVVFLVMSILVGLFAWIYFRARGETAGLWMLGWTAILVHFAVPVLGQTFHWPRPVLIWLKVGTLITAGTFFLLSVSDVFAVKQRRVRFLCLITSAALLYLTGLVLGWRQPWYYAGLLLVSNLYGLYEAARFHEFRSSYFYSMAALVPYGGWTIT